MVEKRAKISVREYVGFGVVDPATLVYLEKNYGYYVGETTSENKLHGRGIVIFSDGLIQIAYFNNVSGAPGNYFIIFTSGVF